MLALCQTAGLPTIYKIHHSILHWVHVISIKNISICTIKRRHHTLVLTARSLQNECCAYPYRRQIARQSHQGIASATSNANRLQSITNCPSDRYWMGLSFLTTCKIRQRRTCGQVTIDSVHIKRRWYYLTSVARISSNEAFTCEKMRTVCSA